MNSTCHLFYWQAAATNLQSSHSNKHLLLRNFSTSIFQYLFDAVTVQFPPIFVSDSFTESYRKYSNIYKYEKYAVTKNSYEAFNVLIRKSEKTIEGGNIFRYKENVYISIQYICDGKIDCPEDHPADELGCDCNTENDSKMCKYFRTKSNEKVCSLFYVQKE